MTAQEIQKRNEKAKQLRVIQVDGQTFFVESGEGKISYRVTISDEQLSCTCGDFARGIKSDRQFKCKHILSVLNCNMKEVETGSILFSSYGNHFPLAPGSEKRTFL